MLPGMARVLAGLKKVDVDTLVKQCWDNGKAVYGIA